MIVGHKIEQYLTAERFDYGGHWEITTHRVVTELHATKGWRQTRHTKHIQNVRRLPSVTDWRKANVTMFVRGRRPGPVAGPRGWLENASPAARDRAINRHKARRVEIQRAKNLAALAAG